MMNGIGEFKWKDGKKYIGNYKNDKKDGFGIYSWKIDKKIFIGFWSGGKQDGIGKYMDKKRTKYGIWKNGKRVKWFIEENEIYEFLDGELKKFKIYFQMNFDKLNEYLDIFNEEV